MCLTLSVVVCIVSDVSPQERTTVMMSWIDQVIATNGYDPFAESEIDPDTAWDDRD